MTVPRLLYIFSLFFFTSLLLQKNTAAQGKKITIEGTVIDPATEETLPFVNFMFVGTTIGDRADAAGNFKFMLDKWPSDSLQVSFVGYKKEIIFLDTNTNYLKLKIELERSTASLKQLVIKYDPNEALKLIKKVIENKDANNQNKADNYKYEVYNKLELDITKIPKRTFSGKGLLKEFAFMKDFIDSSNGDKPFLPLFLTETISDYYFQSEPLKSKEYIKGTRISGYKNASVSKFLGSMYQNINVYDNYIPIFDIEFVSPISTTAPLFYKYTIVDTVTINFHDYYKVLFEPKRKGDKTFRGDIYIHERDYAVQKISMQVADKQAVNWAEDINLVQEYSQIDGYDWFLVKDKFYVDFIPSKIGKTAGFIGRKTTTYKDIVINDKSVTDLFEDKNLKEDLVVLDGADEKDEEFWNDNRHDELSANERSIYKMIDTIQSLPVYNKYYNLIYFLSTGIKEFGPIEFGPIYNTYSRNFVEGNRYRLSLGTTPALFKNAYINGYIAYGTRDERFKFNANALYLLNRNPRRYINVNYKKDVDNSVSVYDTDAGSIDNVFSTIGRKNNVPWKLLFTDKKRIEFFNENHLGFSQLLSVEHRYTTPYAPLPTGEIFSNADGFPMVGVRNFEVGLQLRFAYMEKYVEGNYWRTSLGTKYPAIKLYAGLGLKNVFQSDVSYFKLRFTIADNQPLGSLGKLGYTIFAGKIFGTLPYTLLEAHPGNEFYYYNGRTFNMMNRFEYISDTYVGLMMEHSLGSFVFKYVPLLRKANLRTFWTAKGVYGSISSENRALNFGEGFEFKTLANAPYLELGTGVENIFRLLRIDFVWRVLPATIPNESPTRRFGIFGSIKFAF